MNDPRVLRLKTAEECEQFAKNVSGEHPNLAKQARRRAVELRSQTYGASSPVEQEALRCIFALEEVRSQETGRSYRANRTWQSVRRNGILATVENIVKKNSASVGYEALVEAGMEDFTFEAVVLGFPDSFSDDAILQARSRLESRAK